ncbi:MAG: EVE domain-containing protein [Candidatus Poseidoniaceae archaeon]|tara:strand:+ start:4027 stop:4551 length:525 start_codon:yes stop_codon:yes gene_type:complete
MFGEQYIQMMSAFGIHMAGYWLMKSEPHVYPFEQLISDGSTHWDGVRNYQARNMMRDDMKQGDLVLFYHSNFKPPHVAGVARVCREGYPDFTAQDVNSKYFDSKATPDNPRWMMVDIEPVVGFENIVSLQEIKDNPKCDDMLLVRKGQRLSVQPVEEFHFHTILEMGGIDPKTL